MAQALENEYKTLYVKTTLLQHAPELKKIIELKQCKTKFNEVQTKRLGFLPSNIVFPKLQMIVASLM
jgi:hypothetical protein